MCNLLTKKPCLADYCTGEHIISNLPWKNNNTNRKSNAAIWWNRQPLQSWTVWVKIRTSNIWDTVIKEWLWKMQTRRSNISCYSLFDFQLHQKDLQRIDITWKSFVILISLNFITLSKIWKIIILFEDLQYGPIGYDVEYVSFLFFRNRRSAEYKKEICYKSIPPQSLQWNSGDVIKQSQVFISRTNLL